MEGTLLPNDYIAGLTDGEGCFSLTYRRDVRKERKGSPVYFRWKALFAIVMRSDDVNLLELVRNSLSCGRISFSRTSASYQVQDTNQLLSVIVPFFRRHRLFGKKHHDFELWAEAVAILAKNKHKVLRRENRDNGVGRWDEKDIVRLSFIRDEMRKYKSKGSKYKWI